MCHWCQTLDRFLQREKHPAFLSPLLPLLRSFHTATKPRLAIWYENRLGIMYGLKQGLSRLKILPAVRALIEEADEEIEFLKKGLREHDVDVDEIEKRIKDKKRGKDGVVEGDASEESSLDGDVEGLAEQESYIGIENLMAGARGGSLAESIANGDMQRTWMENRERGEEDKISRAATTPADHIDDVVHDHPGRKLKPELGYKNEAKKEATGEGPQKPKYSIMKGWLVYLDELVAYEVEERMEEGRNSEGGESGEGDEGGEDGIETEDQPRESTGRKLTKGGGIRPGLFNRLFGKRIKGKPNGGVPAHGGHHNRTTQEVASIDGEPSDHSRHSTHSGPSSHAARSRYGESAPHNLSIARGVSRPRVERTRDRNATLIAGATSAHTAPPSRAAPSTHSQLSRRHPPSARASVPPSPTARSSHSQPSSRQPRRQIISTHEDTPVLPADSISQQGSPVSSVHVSSHSSPQSVPRGHGLPTTTDSSSSSSSTESEDEEEHASPPQSSAHPIPASHPTTSQRASVAHSRASSISHLSAYDGTSAHHPPLRTHSTTHSSSHPSRSNAARTPLIPSVRPSSYHSRQGTSRQSSRPTSASRDAGGGNVARIPNTAPPTYASDRYEERYAREYGTEGALGSLGERL